MDYSRFLTVALLASLAVPAGAQEVDCAALKTTKIPYELHHYFKADEPVFLKEIRSQVYRGDNGHVRISALVSSHDTSILNEEYKRYGLIYKSLTYIPKFGWSFPRDFSYDIDISSDLLSTKKT